MDYDMSRWVKPQNDQEGTVAKRIDAFFKANYSDKIIGDGEDYRVIVDIKPLSTDKQSASMHANILLPVRLMQLACMMSQIGNLPLPISRI